MSSMINYSLISIVIFLIFFSVYFDRRLKNHNYLLFYGIYFTATFFTVIIFWIFSFLSKTAEKHLLIVLFANELLWLLTAARKFLGTKKYLYLYPLLIFVTVTKILAVEFQIYWVFLASYIPNAFIYALNAIALIPHQRLIDKIFLFITNIGFLLTGMLLYTTDTPQELLCRRIAPFIGLAFILLWGHVSRLQQERDSAILENYNLRDALKAVDNLENALLNFINGHNNDRRESS